jgi:diacylglycerol O-acyltransferase / trehalose O-mycolyltransferase
VKAVRGTVGAAVAACLLLVSTSGGIASDDQAPTTDSGMDLRGLSTREPAETCAPAQVPFDADHIQLTGRWMADDGGMYYISQVDDTVWWSGMSDYEQRYGEMGRDWNNVAQGTLDGELIRMQFADIPHGNVWGHGDLLVRVEPTLDDSIQLRRTSGNFGGTIFTPCAPEPQEVSSFALPFTYTVPWGMSAATWIGPVDQKVVVTSDVPDSGLTFWLLGPGLATTCSAGPGSALPTEGSPESLIAYLRTIPQLEIGEPVSTTVGGLPALQVDVSTTDGATGCVGDSWVRMWKESGREASIQAGARSRLLLLAADGRTFAIEVWGPNLDAWGPEAQRILDTLQLDPAKVLADPVGAAADDGARIVRVDVLDERTRDLVIESPSVGYARVRLLLPDGFEQGTSASWPTLYLLHGADDDYTSWTRETDVEDIAELRNLLVAMPDAGEQGWYSDWLNGGAGGQPAWETFHTVELPQLLERNWGAGSDRVVAGLSMGGFGALSYAARHPGMFKAAASYSGVVDTVGSDFQADPLMWGLKRDDQDVWAAHNPLSQAAALEGVDLYLSYGDGRPGPLDSPNSEYDQTEWWLLPQNQALVAELQKLGIPATVDAYGAGTHSWPYWERGLHESLPVLLGALTE